MPRARAVRIPATLGRYRITSMIAAGGMGVVYRGVDPITSAVVAIKSVDATRPLNLACFRRETHALTRIEHPGIVRMREQGTDLGVPWCAMDLVEGTPFRQLLSGEDARTGGAGNVRVWRPLRGRELTEVLRIVRRLCAPLAFLHGEGIVHRDLKPANVVVTPDGWPVIVDFGLAARFSGDVSREEISSEAHAQLGTLGYMAPEQRRGELYDARVDIYAMGCILYEAITGQLPELSAPRRPSQLGVDVDRGLEALVMRLLADDPRERLGYADSLASALTSFVGADPGPALAAKTYLYRPTFAGRSETLGQLVSWVDGATGGLALVRGESGVGKTRVVMEVARALAHRDVRVVTAECVPVSGTTSAGIQAAPLHPLRPLLRAIADHCRASGAETTERLLGKRLRVLGAYEPELLELATTAHVEPADLSPQGRRARLFADLAETIAAFAGEMPLLLFIDDVHWMDELTLTFLAEQMDQLGERHVRVIGTYRSDAVDAPLERLVASAQLVVDVHRLDDRAVAAMVSDMLAMAAPPETLIRFMGDHSEGNPFFVAEYLRAAVHAAWLTRDPSGSWVVASVEGSNDALPLPRSLRELVTQRLSGLSEAAARFIDASAVLGREVESALLVAMLQLDEATELEVIEELLRRQVFDETPSESLRFSHDKLREAVYARLAGDERQRLHERAAFAIERARGSEPTMFGVLAHHLLQAGLEERAVDYLEKAGEHALHTAAHGQARQFFERALALSSPSVGSLRRSRWMRKVAEAAFGQGDIAHSERRALETLSRLTGELPSTKLGWVASISGALARQSIGWIGAARASRSEPERARSLEAALVAGQLASTYYFTGEALPMVASLLMGVNLADRAGSPSAVAESYARLAYVAGVAGVHRAANHYFRRANGLAGEQVSASGRALTLYLHSFYHLGLAEWTQAVAKGREALALLVAIGDRQDAEIAQTIVGHAVFFSGRALEARHEYEQVLESARGRGNRQHEAWALFLLGRSDLTLGDVEPAIEQLERALALLAPLADPMADAMCRGLLAQAYLARGDRRAATGVISPLEATLAGPILPLVACVHGYIGAAEVFLAAGDLARVRIASRNLSRFARTFPMASAAALRVRARWDLLTGHPARASRRLRKSVMIARVHAMPYEEALSLALVQPSPKRSK